MSDDQQNIPCPLPSRSPSCGSALSFSIPLPTGSGRPGGRRTAIHSNIFRAVCRRIRSLRASAIDAVGRRGVGRSAGTPTRRRCGAGRPCNSGLLRAGRPPRLSVRATAAVGLLRKAGLDPYRTRCRATPSERVDPGCRRGSRQDQPFAAMKIDRPKPVR